MANDVDDKEFEELAIKSLAEKRPTILLFQEADGNWRGGMQFKFDHDINVRGVAPETVLQMLLTHDGK